LVEEDIAEVDLIVSNYLKIDMIVAGMGERRLLNILSDHLSLPDA
jgi:hypothetical protein